MTLVKEKGSTITSETAQSRFESMLARGRNPYKGIVTSACWTTTEQKQWHAKLTNIDLVDDDTDLAWSWILPRSSHEQKHFSSCADQVMELAAQYPLLQKMMQRLDGPAVHLPALFWRIVQTLEMEHDANRRDEQLQQRRRLLKDANAIRAALSKASANYENLVLATRDNRDLCVAWVTANGGRADAWVDLQIRRLLDANENLKNCLQTLEDAEQNLWGPIANQTISNSKIDTYSVHQLFYIAKTMLGDRRWGPMYMMMDAVSAVLGFTNPYGLDGLKERWKELRKNPRDFESLFNQAIERRRMEYLIHFHNAIMAAQANGVLPEK
jgi:hypothetical protein